MILLDELRLGFTLVFLIVSALTLLVSMVWVENERLPAGEFHSLLMFATAGMMFMASAHGHSLQRVVDEVFHSRLVLVGISALRNCINLRRNFNCNWPTRHDKHR